MKKEDIKIGMKVTWNKDFYNENIMKETWLWKEIVGGSRHGINNKMRSFVIKNKFATIAEIKSDTVYFLEDEDKWNWEFKGLKPLEIKDIIKFIKI